MSWLDVIFVIFKIIEILFRQYIIGLIKNFMLSMILGGNPAEPIDIMQFCQFGTFPLQSLQPVILFQINLIVDLFWRLSVRNVMLLIGPDIYLFVNIFLFDLID